MKEHDFPTGNDFSIYEGKGLLLGEKEACNRCGVRKYDMYLKKRMTDNEQYFDKSYYRDLKTVFDRMSDCDLQMIERVLEE